MKRKLQGVVASQNSLNTVKIFVFDHYRDLRYKKVLKKIKKITAHYENLDLKIGDSVFVLASRPFSKTKRFLVSSVINKK